VFLGGGTETDRLKQLAASAGLSNVSFRSRVPVSEVGAYLARADALLVHLQNQALFHITVPSKTQAYMAAGRPVLMAVGGDAADLVRRANCGIVCEPENPEGLARAVETLAAMTAGERRTLGENGRRFYESVLSLRAGTRAFESIFRAVCSSEQALPPTPATSSQL
jgi:glycosyltransferase involved in cell wall biosynthesis